MARLFTFLFLLVPLSLLAQKETFIRGVLKDSLTAEPLAYATLRLENSESKDFLKGELSDDKGEFRFSGISQDKYVIRIEYVGYQTKYIEVPYANVGQNLDLGAITLSPLAQLLEAVNVSGIKPNTVVTLEKQVFKAEQFEIAKGGTATDVLKNIPSVMVNAEGEIMVRGSKGFLILVNGKPTQLDAVTILSQIPANTIEKVEMITAPSAKYDADGKAGIINIVTKKGATDGLSVTTNLQYGLPRIKAYENTEEPKRYGADLALNYRKQKWDVSVGLNYLKNDIAGRRVGDVNTTIGDIYTHFPSEGERSFKRDNYGFRTMITYYANAKNEMNGGIYLGHRDQYRLADIYYNNTKTDLFSNSVIGRAQYFNSNLVLKEGTFKVYNLDYLHRFDETSSITFSALYEDAVIEGWTKNRNLNSNDFSDTLQYTLNNGFNPLKAFRGKVDYEKTIGSGKISMGYQFRNQLQDGSFEYLEKNANNDPFVLNPAFSASISVLNRIHGIYSQYSGNAKNLEFSGGLRYENAYRRFSDDRGGDAFELPLSNLFPSAGLKYNFSNNWSVKAAYSRRVQRSTNNELNPYPEREHSETMEQGDPEIRPEFIGLYEAGLLKDFRKASFYWNVYHQRIQDIVNRVNSVYNDTILNRIYTNAGNARLTGSEIGLTLMPVKALKIFLGGNVYNLNIEGSLFENQVNVNSRGWVYSVNSNASYQFSPSLSTQLGVNYLSKRNTAQGEDSRFYQPTLSVKKGFKSNQINLSLLWQNISFGEMGVNEQRITTWGQNFFTTTNYIQETNIFMLNLSYNFNKRDKASKLPSSEFGEREF